MDNIQVFKCNATLYTLLITFFKYEQGIKYIITQ